MSRMGYLGNVHVIYDGGIGLSVFSVALDAPVYSFTGIAEEGYRTLCSPFTNEVCVNSCVNVSSN